MSRKEEPRVLGHADEADGIEEYDNPLPDWWLGLFWFTIVWAIAYTAHYHFIADKSQEATLAAEMAEADARYPDQAQATLAFSYSESAAAGGETVYAQNCFPCHGQNLEGGIGPSFIDDEWVHGGTAADIKRIVQEGVLDKGMVAWQGVLSPEQINNVTAYIVQQNMQATGRDLESYMRASEGDASDTEMPEEGNAGAEGTASGGTPQG